MMDEYITRNNVISAVCFGCNQEFSDEPCEPSQCAIRQSIMALPIADVVPKSEVERLEYTLQGVMWSVDKWLDEAEYNPDPVKRAITMREKTLQIVENLRADVASDIFAEIETCMKDFEDDDDGYILKKCEFEFFMRELKKKYTEGESA